MIKLHYDGWLTLPASLRAALQVTTGDTLEVELADGTVVLRPSRGAQGSTMAGHQPAADPAAAGPEPEPMPPRRKPGRPRKSVAPVPPPAPVAETPWKLRKAVRQPAVAPGEPAGVTS